MKLSGFFNRGLKAILYQQLTITNAVQTLVVPEHARSALLAVEANALSTAGAIVIRFTEDGQNPSASFGMQLINNAIFEVRPGSLKTIKFIRADANDQIINITYYG